MRKHYVSRPSFMSIGSKLWAVEGYIYGNIHRDRKSFCYFRNKFLLYFDIQSKFSTILETRMNRCKNKQFLSNYSVLIKITIRVFKANYEQLLSERKIQIKIPT